MKHWQNLLQNSVIHPEELVPQFNIDVNKLEKVTSIYPMRVNPYYLKLINRPGDPFWLQAVPDEKELSDSICQEDPLNEENLSPVPSIVHKYNDRALFLVTSQCAMYCRFCTRKRKVGTKRMAITHDEIKAGIEYLKNTPAIRDVLISGGDPLLLDDDILEWILDSVRKISNIQIIRIGTRVPCTLPMRVTIRLANILKKYHPLYINTHFNHPAEITPQAAKACGRLANAGIPLGCQTVLLRGVNDQETIIKELMQKLLQIRVKPYYLFQTDMTSGTNHFRTPIEQGQIIMRSLIGHTSGLAVPTYALDAPGGGGKIPLTPNYIKQRGNTLIFNNYCGDTYSYGNIIL